MDDSVSRGPHSHAGDSGLHVRFDRLVDRILSGCENCEDSSHTRCVGSQSGVGVCVGRVQTREGVWTCNSSAANRIVNANGGGDHCWPDFHLAQPAFVWLLRCGK